MTGEYYRHECAMQARYFDSLPASHCRECGTDRMEVSFDHELRNRELSNWRPNPPGAAKQFEVAILVRDPRGGGTRRPTTDSMDRLGKARQLRLWQDYD